MPIYDDIYRASLRLPNRTITSIIKHMLIQDPSIDRNLESIHAGYSRWFKNSKNLTKRGEVSESEPPKKIGPAAAPPPKKISLLGNHKIFDYDSLMGILKNHDEIPFGSVILDRCEYNNKRDRSLVKALLSIQKHVIQNKLI